MDGRNYWLKKIKDGTHRDERQGERGIDGPRGWLLRSAPRRVGWRIRAGALGIGVGPGNGQRSRKRLTAPANGRGFGPGRPETQFPKRLRFFIKSSTNTAAKTDSPANSMKY